MFLNFKNHVSVVSEKKVGENKYSPHIKKLRTFLVCNLFNALKHVYKIWQGKGHSCQESFFVKAFVKNAFHTYLVKLLIF